MKMLSGIIYLIVQSGYPKSRQNHDATINKLETEHLPPKPSVKVLLFRGGVIIIYLLLGALVFQALENNKDNKGYHKNELEKEKSRITSRYNISEEILLKYERLVERSRLETIRENKKWDYYQSLYFASTVTTTIGYGHLTPQTQSGRLFLILFSLIGIPLNILALASVGEHITIGIWYTLQRISKKCGNPQPKKHINIKVMIVSVILMLLMLFIGGILYCMTENWTYVDSMYYCFVAMATIGFGDLVPNRGKAPDTPEEKGIWFLRALYISVGLSLVSTVFTALSNAMEEINALRGRDNYPNEWCPNHDDTNEKSSIREKSCRSEKISYKHKIKKHGKTIMKYKFFRRLRPHHEDFYRKNDWDVMFNEAKQKKVLTESPVSLFPTLTECESPSKQNVVKSKPHIYRSNSYDPSKKYSMSYRKKAAEIRQFPSIRFYDAAENLVSLDTEASVNGPKRSCLFKHRTFDIAEKDEEIKQPLMVRQRSIPVSRNRSYPLDKDFILDQHRMHDQIDLDGITCVKHKEKKTKYSLDASSEMERVRNNLLWMTEEEYDIVLNQC